MVVSITYKSGSRWYYMSCECIEQGETTERYKLWATRNPAKYIVLQNNRPLLRNKLHLKNKRIAWKVVEGKVNNPFNLQKVIEMIEAGIPQ